MKLRGVFAAAVAIFLLCEPSAAQQTSADTEELVVVQAPTREIVRRFVDEMAIAPRSQNQMARWDRKICPGVAGLRTRYAQFVIDRMAQRAIDVGLDVGAPGCKANVLIVVTPDPDGVARELTEEFPRAMGYYHERLRATLGRRALAAFAASDAPVRWWHVSRMVSASGELIRDPPPTSRGSDNTILALTLTYPVVFSGGNTSRLTRDTHQDFGAAYIVVDAHRLEDIGFDLAALADYLTMVTLAQLDPDADTSVYPTILNLFARSGDPSTRSLTDWDLAFLRGVYSEMTRDARSANQQEGEITRSMARDLSSPSENTPP